MSREGMNRCIKCGYCYSELCRNGLCYTCSCYQAGRMVKLPKSGTIVPTLNEQEHREYLRYRTWDQQPIKWRRHRVEPNLFMLMFISIGLLFRLAGKIIKNTGKISLEGHWIMWSWLRDSGLRTRTDGLQALAAVGYLCASFLAYFLISMQLLLVVIL